MLSVNGKNCHVTRRIGVGLKRWKGAQSTELGWLSSWVQSRVRLDGCTWADEQWGRDRCSGITLQVKCRGQLIVRLKAIESREDTFCYLSFYLHHSFLWYLVIVTFIYYIIKSSSRGRDLWSYRERPLVSKTSARIIAPSNRPQPLNHRGLELLRRSLGNSNVSVLLSECSVIVPLSNRNCFRYYYLVWELFKWSFLLYHLINRKLSFLKYKRSKTWFTALMNYALTSNYSPGSICVHLLDHLELRLDLLPSAVSTTQGRWASATQGRRASTTQGRPGRSWCWRPKSQVWPRPASRLSHHFTRGSSSGFPL